MITSCLQYHVTTSYERSLMQGHGLDWENQPNTFKQYPGTTPVSLPEPGEFPESRVSEILRQRDSRLGRNDMDVKELSNILFLSYSLTARARHGSGYFYFRSVPSAGALYPAEVYLASQGVEGLEKGLYHFSIAQHGLNLLRTEGLEQAPHLTLFITAIFFRSCWKYRDRGYRYCLLDAGHLLENMVLAFGATGRNLECTYDFNDSEVNGFLGLDEQREVCLSIARFSKNGEYSLRTSRFTGKPLQGLSDASKVSGREVIYPAVIEAHKAGMHKAQNTGNEQIPASMVRRLGLSSIANIHASTPGRWPEKISYKDAVFSRRSMRNFLDTEMRGDAFMALVEGLCLSASQAAKELIGVGLLVNKAEAQPPGYYLLDLDKRELAMIKEGGESVDLISRICLEQSWIGKASILVLFMANLGIVESEYGPRGYRHAMLEAGRMGQSVYICATSMGYGCCGIGAFYDEEARLLLDLDQDSRLVYLVAMGAVAARKKQFV